MLGFRNGRPRIRDNGMLNTLQPVGRQDISTKGLFSNMPGLYTLGDSVGVILTLSDLSPSVTGDRALEQG